MRSLRVALACAFLALLPLCLDAPPVAQAQVVTTTQPSATATGPASTQATTATATVETRTTFGTLGADVLTWVMALAGGAIATGIVSLIVLGFKKAGVELSEERKVQIRSAVLAGLNWGAAQLGKGISGAGPEITKAGVLGKMIEYVETQKPALISAMGEKVGSPTLHQALTAHAETLINNPAVATPPAITPPEGKPIVILPKAA